MNKYIGICIGAQSVSIVETERNNSNNIKVQKVIQKLHNGEPKKILDDYFNNLTDAELEETNVVITGRKFRNVAKLTNISEAEANSYALEFITKKYNVNFDAIASLGAETFILYNIINSQITNVYSKNKCAAGTGEFFQQQIKRMNLTFDEVNNVKSDIDIYKVSGRCSVFCKSDCTHALNKGVPKENVVAGLCKMLSEKIEELLHGRQYNKILLTGSVTRNKLAMQFLADKNINFSILEESTYFEALGAAVYAHSNNVIKFPLNRNIFLESKSSFIFNKELNKFKDRVTFKNTARRTAENNEECILGLDVGSTTTKAVLVSTKDDAVLASVYLYTNGNPIEASKKCYKSLLEQIPQNVNIIGLGTTGSGRQIAALHALTTSVYNEITAHAAAAVYYDPEVDTIFEIGGQDAKYTHLINRVPVDYAMNEACSAGTGSFIEEAAKETLNISLEQLETFAFKGENPPNFSDQCAAFISSDIKTALQEGISKENIVAGLTYSICLNYLNRVKNNRPVGHKIFMQGGVCYNKAVPVAMAALANVDIIVPPEPGLMGAFGVALQVKEKINLGLTEKQLFDLNTLINREIKQTGSFICQGTKEQCDIGCKIGVFSIEGKKYPFGGACDKYSNLKIDFDSNKNTLIESEQQTAELDLVKVRNKLVFEKYAPAVSLPNNAKVIGINNSFYTHTLYPLYYNFFTKLGFKVVLSNELDADSSKRENTSFCFPMQLAVSLFKDLVNKKVDYVFMPAVFEMDAEKEEVQRLDFNCACAFVTGEPYIISQAYKDIDNIKDRILSPSINFNNGLKNAKQDFVKVANKLIGKENYNLIEEAFDYAVEMQINCQKELRKIGGDFIKELKNNPDNFAIVLVGRTYNSTPNNANKGIPNKFVSNSIPVIPLDMLELNDCDEIPTMYWEAGHRILKAAKIIRDNPQLFATYITNFSCAPDSMILNRFRVAMGEKPSLTLELDSHSADAGITTRVAAAIDIIKNYRRLNAINNNQADNADKQQNNAARLEFTDPIATFITVDGERVPLNDKRVLVLIPAMSELATRMVAESFRSCGIDSVGLPIHSSRSMQLGRQYASGKECLPIILMAGNLLQYLEEHPNEDRLLVYFQVQGAGNCRLGQYPNFLEQMIKDKKLGNIVPMVLMNEDGFAGLGTDWSVRAIQSIIATDVLDDIKAGILTYAVSPEKGIEIFYREFDKLLEKFRNNPKNLYSYLEDFAKTIKKEVPSKVDISEFKYIAMIGEIFCRRDVFANKNLTEYFAKNGFVLKTAYISEWIAYIDYLISIDLLESDKSIIKRFERMLRNFFMKDAEKKIKKALELSGYYKFERMNIEAILKHSKHIVPLEYKGEPGLTLGIALNDIFDKYYGVINFGPFGCMPTRFAEAVTVPEMTVDCKIKAKQIYNSKYKINTIDGKELPKNYPLPFLTIESDGTPYSQLIESRLEAFLLQCKEVDKKINI